MKRKGWAARLEHTPGRRGEEVINRVAIRKGRMAFPVWAVTLGQSFL